MKLLLLSMTIMMMFGSTLLFHFTTDAHEMRSAHAFPRDDGPSVGAPPGYTGEKKSHRKHGLFGFLNKKKIEKVC